MEYREGGSFGGEQQESEVKHNGIMEVLKYITKEFPSQETKQHYDVSMKTICTKKSTFEYNLCEMY